MIYGVLAPNPEAYREQQYREYQSRINDEDDNDGVIKCVACRCDIPENEEVYLSESKHCCTDCIIYEMEQGNIDFDDAINVLKKYTP